MKITKRLHKALLLAAMSAVVATSFTGCGKGGDDAAAASSSDVQLDENGNPIDPNAAASVDEGNIIEATGTVIAEYEKEITLDFPATITKVYVKKGQEIKKGDILFDIDYEDYKATITRKQKEGELQKAQLDAQLSSSSGSVQKINSINSQIADKKQRIADGTDSDIANINDQIANNNAEIERAEKEKQDIKDMVEAGVATQKEVDDLQAKIDTLKATNDQLAAKIDTIKKDKQAEINSLQDQIADINDQTNQKDKSDAATVKSYNIQQELNDLDIKDMKAKYNKAFLQGNSIVSNYEGAVVKDVKVAEGAVVGDSTGALIQLLDTQSYVVRAKVSEEFIKDVKVGADVNIIPYADKEAVIKGKVREIENIAEEDGVDVVIPIVIEVTGESPYIKYGYSVDVEISK